MLSPSSVRTSRTFLVSPSLCASSAFQAAARFIPSSSVECGRESWLAVLPLPDLAGNHGSWLCNVRGTIRWSATKSVGF